jgi:hypothetical protein
VILSLTGVNWGKNSWIPVYDTKKMIYKLMKTCFYVKISQPCDSQEEITFNKCKMFEEEPD